MECRNLNTWSAGFGHKNTQPKIHNCPQRKLQITCYFERVDVGFTLIIEGGCVPDLMILHNNQKYEWMTLFKITKTYSVFPPYDNVILNN